MLKSVISPKTPTSPRVYQQEDASTPNGSSPTADIEDDEHHHNLLIRKFSVLAKVKERAKKWRHSLSKKRMHSPHDHDHDQTYPTTPWGVTLDDHEQEEDDHHHDPHNVEDDSEFFGTPMHEFEHPLEDHKETSDSRQRQLGSSSSKELDTYETAKMNNLTIGVPESPLTDWEDEQQEWMTPGGAHNWDKGVSVKEYLIEKLKPGEDDKALSQVISDAISLRKKDTTDNLRPKEEQLAVHSTTDSMTNFPVSTNPHEEVTEEENRGRVLQTN